MDLSPRDNMKTWGGNLKLVWGCSKKKRSRSPRPCGISLNIRILQQDHGFDLILAVSLKAVIIISRAEAVGIEYDKVLTIIRQFGIAMIVVLDAAAPVGYGLQNIRVRSLILWGCSRTVQGRISCSDSCSAGLRNWPVQGKRPQVAGPFHTLPDSISATRLSSKFPSSNKIQISQLSPRIYGVSHK